MVPVGDFLIVFLALEAEGFSDPGMLAVAPAPRDRGMLLIDYFRNSFCRLAGGPLA